MRDYEVTIILKADLDDKKLDAWVKSFEALLTKNSAKAKGKLTPEKKALAYEIMKGVREANYVYSEVEMGPDKLSAIEPILKNDDSVMRYLIVKKNS